MPATITPTEADRTQRLAHSRRLQTQSPPLNMGAQGQPSGARADTGGNVPNAAEEPSAMERSGNSIPGDSTAKAAGAAAGEVVDIMQTVRQEGIPAAMRKIGASYIQIVALATKELGKKTLGSDWGTLFFIGANIQILLLFAGKRMKKLPMELWELLLILFIDIVIFLIIITVAGFISGMVSYVKQHQGDALYSIFFGALQPIKDIIPY